MANAQNGWHGNTVYRSSQYDSFMIFGELFSSYKQNDSIFYIYWPVGGAVLKLLMHSQVINIIRQKPSLL